MIIMTEHHIVSYNFMMVKVGNSFVSQYYPVLHHNPKYLYRFYTNASVMTHADENSNGNGSSSGEEAMLPGHVETVVGQADIHHKVMKLGLEGATAEIKSVDSQYSLQDGVIVQVTGFLTNKNLVKKGFVQTFFLAVQEKGYYVRNDVFRYINLSENTGDDAGSMPDSNSSTNSSSSSNNNTLVADGNKTSTMLSSSVVVETETAAEVLSRDDQSSMNVNPPKTSNSNSNSNSNSMVKSSDDNVTDKHIPAVESEKMTVNDHISGN